MKALFYFFGIGRGEKTFAIKDAIMINDYRLSTLNEYSLERVFENKLNLKNFIAELRKDRGVLFGVVNNSEKLSKFLKFGKLLSPDIIEQPFSIYFLKDKKLILFKVNKIFFSWKEIKKEIWKIFEPLEFISKKEFSNLTKDWKDYEYDNETFSCETRKFKLCVGNFYYIFICLKPKNYNQLKNKIKKVYKGQPQNSSKANASRSRSLHSNFAYQQSFV